MTCRKDKTHGRFFKNMAVGASVFTIGCYTVRIADCLYMDGKGVNDMYRIPAGRYCSGSSELVDHWQNICMAAQTHRGIGSESIDYICTVKRCHAVSDGQAVLFVLRRYWGDSYTSESWYKFTPDGRAESYHIHGYGQDDTDVWKL